MHTTSAPVPELRHKQCWKLQFGVSWVLKINNHKFIHLNFRPSKVLHMSTNNRSTISLTRKDNLVDPYLVFSFWWSVGGNHANSTQKGQCSDLLAVRQQFYPLNHCADSLNPKMLLKFVLKLSIHVSHSSINVVLIRTNFWLVTLNLNI